MAIMAALPIALSVLQVDARQDAAIETEGVALVNYQVVEIRLEPGGCPHFLRRPTCRTLCDRQAPRTHSSAHVTAGNQDAAIRCHRRLQNGRTRPGMRPELFPARRDAHETVAGHQEHLPDSADAHQLRGTIAAGAL